MPSHPQDDAPIMHFDQPLTVAHHHNAARCDQKPNPADSDTWMDPHASPSAAGETTNMNEPLTLSNIRALQFAKQKIILYGHQDIILR